VSVSTPTSRADEIARGLRDEILRGSWRPGERLPSERELAARTGAHRSSVREALKKLEQLRLIEIHPGGGARVAPLDQASLDVLIHLLDREGGPDPVLAAQWLDVHELVLTGAVRLAVERATPEEIDRARALVARLADPGLDDEGFLHTTDALAELISRASRNLVLRMVRSALKSIFTRRLGRRAPVRLRLPPDALAPLAAAVDEALARRDPLAAEEAVRRLLRGGRERLLEAIEARRGRTG